MINLIKILVFLVLFSTSILAQEIEKPEPQISFAKEKKPLKYYVRQAELWWEEIQKNKKSENSWYNYYRACRNAQGKANWSSDFLKESPDLRLGDDIVKLMEEHIPDTFIYNFVKGSTAAVYPGNGKYLMKAYKMNPNFPYLLSDVVTYATSTHNPELRKEANQKWFANNGISEPLLSYGYNLLNSLEPNSILLTAHDNDSYPVWMLQDAKNIYPNVLVLNIDFFLYNGFSDKVFADLGVKTFEVPEIDINEYEKNWKNGVRHFLKNYTGDRAIYISKTVAPKFYEGFEKHLHTSGLALKLSKKKLDLEDKNINFLENIFLMDMLKIQLNNDPIQAKIDEMNLNYLELFKIAFKKYKKDNQAEKAKKIKELALKIVVRIDNQDLRKKYKTEFE